MFAIDDAFRKIVRQILEDGLLSGKSHKFEVCPRNPGLKMCSIDNQVTKVTTDKKV
jgi:hypothetical protein